VSATSVYIKPNTQLLMPLILASPLAAFSAKQRTVIGSDTYVSIERRQLHRTQAV
jgi:hypothetical protein